MGITARLINHDDVALYTDPVGSASVAGLRYVSDAAPGIRRRRAGKGFVFLDAGGRPIRNQDIVKRIRSLAIPPAWTDVWISPIPEGHLQASGRDSRGRKQYRYHNRWREVRDETKFNRMVAFGNALSAIRERVEQDLKKTGLNKEKVLATVVFLLEKALIRVGNDEYVKSNKSFGLTTLRNHHVEVNGFTLRFRFRGKGGKQHTVSVSDRRIARVVKQCQEIPGHELFQYEDEEGKCQPISSNDVNDYLREITGLDFTAKDFRTWAGTLLAAVTLEQFDPPRSQTQGKRSVTQAITYVSERLGNTPAICRKCYIHPEVIESYFDGSLQRLMKRPSKRALRSLQLDDDEIALLHLLTRRIDRFARSTKKAA